jgi:iron complex transport system substrate-binding protein
MAGKPSLTQYLSVLTAILCLSWPIGPRGSSGLSCKLAGSAAADDSNSSYRSNSSNSSNGSNSSNRPTAKPRVVSLAPSNTELLCSVGAKDQIIGVSSFCDYPKDVAKITKAGTFISANLERLARLKPDLVMLVSGQEELAGKIKNHHINTVVIANEKLTDIGKNLKRIGELTGHCQEGSDAAQNFEAKLQALAKIIDKSKLRPKVFYCVWPQPLMTAGKASFINGVITSCGGTNVAGDMNASYPRFSLERLVLSNPDLIIMPYEARNQTFIKQSPWNKLQAVRQNKIYYLPDQKNDMLSRPTLRVLKGMAWLGGVFHPELRSELANWSEPTTVAKAASKPLRSSAPNSFNNVYVRN